jgi:hypothetical protein
MNLTIATCISSEDYKKVKNEGWKVPELIRLGIKDREGGFKLLARLNQLENDNKALHEENERIKLHAKMLYKEMKEKKKE